MTTEHTPDWLDNETWEPEQVAEMVRRYRAHADLLAALEAAEAYMTGEMLRGTDGTRIRDAYGAVRAAIDKARGIGQNINTKA